MSRLFGNIEQLGIVVRDADAAMTEWAQRLGVGPFYVFRNCVFENFKYRGKASPTPTLTLGFANSGNLQIEVIQQHNDVPSAYKDFLADGHEGMQHVSSWFGETHAYDKKRQQLLDSGLELIHEGAMVGGLARFSYFSTNLPGATMIELSETRLPALRPLMELLDSSSKNWDGSNPIREFPST
jgi:Glyoxalase/Bleomycin resistance protein/Dioxygenase superfamily